jgi:DNA repair photolyase
VTDIHFPATVQGRGASINPPNRFERLHLETDPEAEPGERPTTELLRDTTRSILSRNDSPDIPFTFSVNPYRGCEHGCAYCYARPTHEYLGFSAGTDFETKILVKDTAAELLRKELSARTWKPQVIALSGNTDPYQPIEKQLGITRACVDVLREFRNPVGVITKNHLVTRDIDLFKDLAGEQAVHVNLSITSLDGDLARVMEPRASQPQRRLDALRALSNAHIPCGVMVGPVIPGLTDHELPAIVQAAAEHGAQWASWIMLRLPHGVGNLFEDWLERHFPDRRSKVMNRVRHMRAGQLNDPRFGTRHRGEGFYAREVDAMFNLARRKAGLTEPAPRLSAASFRAPRPEQLTLF